MMTLKNATEMELDGEPDRPWSPTEKMVAEEVLLEVQDEQKHRLREAWKAPTGWRYWTAVNNSEVGLWYCLSALNFM